jgi:DNA-binding NarL/FixJ family response regulator
MNNNAAASLTMVAIVEDDVAIRQELRDLLDAGTDTRCVAACASGEEALERLPGLRPDVILMDYHLPGIDGVACVRGLSGQLPRTDILMLSVADDTDVVFAALQAGAIGYLHKPITAAPLFDAIRLARSGGAPIHIGIARRLIISFRKPTAADRPAATGILAPREAEILGLMAKGHQHKEIAAQLGISITTVRSHTARMYRKLQVQSQAQAVARYYDHESDVHQGS